LFLPLLFNFVFALLLCPLSFCCHPSPQAEDLLLHLFLPSGLERASEDAEKVDAFVFWIKRGAFSPTKDLQLREGFSPGVFCYSSRNCTFQHRVEAGREAAITLPDERLWLRWGVTPE
jgi:hypothetical protein